MNPFILLALCIVILLVFIFIFVRFSKTPGKACSNVFPYTTYQYDENSNCVPVGCVSDDYTFDAVTGCALSTGGDAEDTPSTGGDADPFKKYKNPCNGDLPYTLYEYNENLDCYPSGMCISDDYTYMDYTSGCQLNEYACTKQKLLNSNIVGYTYDKSKDPACNATCIDGNYGYACELLTAERDWKGITTYYYYGIGTVKKQGGIQYNSKEESDLKSPAIASFYKYFDNKGFLPELSPSNLNTYATQFIAPNANYEDIINNVLKDTISASGVNTDFFVRTLTDAFVQYIRDISPDTLDPTKNIYVAINPPTGLTLSEIRDFQTRDYGRDIARFLRIHKSQNEGVVS